MKRDTEILGKGLPSNLDAERSVLGAILLDSAAYNHVADLPPQDFSSDAHRKIFRAIQALDERGQPIDQIALTELLFKSGELDGVGGVA